MTMRTKTSFEQRCGEAHDVYRAAEAEREKALKVFLDAQTTYQAYCLKATRAFDDWNRATAPVGGMYR